MAATVAVRCSKLLLLSTHHFSQGAVFFRVGGCTGFLFNQHYLSVCRQSAATTGAVVQPVLDTCSVPRVGAACVRWFDPAFPPALGVDGPIPGVQLHETTHDSVRETVAFLEVHEPAAMHVTPQERRHLMPVPHDLSVCLPIRLPVGLSVCLHLSVCLFACLSVCLSVCLVVCLFVWLAVYLAVCLSVGRSVCLSVGLSVCLSVCLYVGRSVCLSVCMYVGLCVCLWRYELVSVSASNLWTRFEIFAEGKKHFFLFLCGRLQDGNLSISSQTWVCLFDFC